MSKCLVYQLKYIKNSINTIWPDMHKESHHGIAARSSPWQFQQQKTVQDAH